MEKRERGEGPPARRQWQFEPLSGRQPQAAEADEGPNTRASLFVHALRSADSLPRLTVSARPAEGPQLTQAGRGCGLELHRKWW